MLRRAWIKGSIALTMAISLSVGCSTGGQGGAAPDAAAPKLKDEVLQPVTLKLFPNQAITEADFNKLIAEPVRKKYPHITVEMIKKDSTRWLQDYVAAGEVMDLISVWHGSIPGFKDLGVFEDMTPLVKKHNFDLGRFDAGALTTIKEVSDGTSLYALPYMVQLNALYYNKDIFDRFGAAYPKDGMTWEEAIELGKKLTKAQDGQQYRGLIPSR